MTDEDYIDEDVAYLLGMLIARGTLREERNNNQIIIEFPYSNIETENMTDQNSLLVSIDNIINRIGELVDLSPRKVPKNNTVDVVLETRKNTLFWRDIKLLLQGRTSYNEFEIPQQVFENNKSIKKEFVLGFGDVAAKVRKSNAYIDNRHRIYFDVLNTNWELPIQMCNLLQDHLKIPVQTITYGHPNLRDPHKERYDGGSEYFWKKEHQIKIFTEDYKGIGFSIKHKHEAFMELVKENEAIKKKPNFCQPPKRPKQIKIVHPMENDGSLPQKIRGKHYDVYTEICCDIGCLRCRKQKRLVLRKVGEFEEG